MLRGFQALLTVLLGTALTLPAATVQYATRQDIATNFQHLTGLAIADFNGDGKLDIAVTDDYNNRIVVYLNAGGGKFGPPVVTTLSATGYGGLGMLVTGDVNEDGKPDLIVAPIAGTQSDIVLIGNGDGTFTQGQIIASTNGFLNAALVDVNGDKHLDLISGGNPQVLVNLGDGKGNFQAATALTQPNSYLFNTGLTVGSFTGGSLPDFVTAAYSSTPLVYRNSGDGSFQTVANPTPGFIYVTGSVLLASADFSGDGKLDLLVGEPEVVFIAPGNGDGTFQNVMTQGTTLALPSATALNNQPSAPLVATADMDASGTADVVVADDNTQLLSVFLNDGTGKFPQSQPDFGAALDAGSGSIAVADLNGDGLPDIIVTNYKNQNISLFLSIKPKVTPTITVQSSAAQTLVGSSVAISVQVKGSGATVPTGTVTLASGTTSYGQNSLDGSGMASFQLPNLATGQYPFIVTYSGDSNYSSGTNTALTQSIADFQVALPSATQTVQTGASATYLLNLSAISGFNGALSITCSGLPSGYTCGPSSYSLTAPSATVSLIVSPTVNSAAAGSGPYDKSSGRKIALVAFTGLCWSLRRRRKLLGAATAGLTLALVCLLPLTGCTASESSAPKPTPYTGTSTFTIVATAAQGTVTSSHQVTATLVVQ